jgi:anti-anti-sigma factor
MITHSLDEKAACLQLKVKGDILSTNAEAVAQGFGEALRFSATFPLKHLDIDLKKARMVDSTGLNVLLGLIRAARERSATVSIHITSPTVHRVFQFSRIDLMTEVIFKEKKSRGAGN